MVSAGHRYDLLLNLTTVQMLVRVR